MGGSKQDEEECNIWDASSFLPPEETIAGFPSASLPLCSSPTQQGFNSEAAEVIFIPFDLYIFTRLPNTSLLNDWTGVTVNMHGDIFGALPFFSLISPVL